MSVKTSIEEKLAAALSLEHLQVENESASHNVPPGSESHFKIIAAASDFEGKALVSRHQQVYKLLEYELKHGVHALALHLFSPVEWGKAMNSSLKSPLCAGLDENYPAG